MTGRKRAAAAPAGELGLAVEGGRIAGLAQQRRCGDGADAWLVAQRGAVAVEQLVDEAFEARHRRKEQVCVRTSWVGLHWFSSADADDTPNPSGPTHDELTTSAPSLRARSPGSTRTGPSARRSTRSARRRRLGCAAR